MKVPNADAAKVDRDKLERYLLSLAHPIGRSKARFLHAAGFGESNVAALAEALKEIAQTEEIVAVASSPHGAKYIVDGLLTTPSGSRVRLRTVWIVETGEDYPRFVTGYPV